VRTCEDKLEFVPWKICELGVKPQKLSSHTTCTPRGLWSHARVLAAAWPEDDGTDRVKLWLGTLLVSYFCYFSLPSSADTWVLSSVWSVRSDSIRLMSARCRWVFCHWSSSFFATVLSQSLIILVLSTWFDASPPSVCLYGPIRTGLRLSSQAVRGNRLVPQLGLGRWLAIKLSSPLPFLFLIGSLLADFPPASTSAKHTKKTPPSARLQAAAHVANTNLPLAVPYPQSYQERLNKVPRSVCSSDRRYSPPVGRCSSCTLF
jgi:hypothetical protein